MPKTIVLLTDYGYRDPYAGILRGVIHKISPRSKVIDLTHGCLPQNIAQAAYYLNSSYRFFPKGTIFVSVVDPGVGTSRKIICLKTKDHYFLAPDNGLLALLYNKEGGLMRSVTNPKFFLRPISDTFHGRDIFAPVAAHLSRRDVFNQLGQKLKSLAKLNHSKPFKAANRLSGRIVFFDHFGNAISNIHRDEIPKRSGKMKINCGKFSLGVESSYNPEKKLTALWNSSGYLEIAKPLGSAEKYIKNGDSVMLTYEK